MRAPRAVGVRAPWPSVPATVRAWVDGVLGSPVVSVAEQSGGLSPGCATRLVCADGTRAFVKAVGLDLNPDTPTLFRREAAVLRLVGDDPLWACLLDAYDDGGWVALLLKDVEGRHPDLGTDHEMERLCRETDALAATLAERVPGARPADPRAPGSGPADFGAVLRHWADALDHVTEVPDLVPAAVVLAAPTLRALLRRQAELPGEQLVHFDIRDDNLLVRPGGELVFVDWGMAQVGPAWVDPWAARLERAESPWFHESVRHSPALCAAGDDVVTACLAGLGTRMAWKSRTVVDVNLPALHDFRVRESARFLAGAARRLA